MAQQILNSIQITARTIYIAVFETLRRNAVIWIATSGTLRRLRHANFCLRHCFLGRRLLMESPVSRVLSWCRPCDLAMIGARDYRWGIGVTEGIRGLYIYIHWIRIVSMREFPTSPYATQLSVDKSIITA